MRVVIVQDDAGQRDYFRQVALSAGLSCAAEDCVSGGDLRVRLGKTPPDLVLVGLGGNPAAACSAIEQALGHSKGPILAVGPTTDPQIIRQAIRAGAREYLDEANLREELSDALHKLTQAGVVDYRHGTTVCVLAPTPGTGVTTVACNLAFALAERHPRRVALAEFGGGVPELALLLDLQPRHGVADLAKNWERLDATMMEQLLVEHPAGVSVLAHPAETLSALPLDVDPLQQSLLILKSTFEYVVVDLGHYLNDSALRAASLADRVLIVVRLDVPCLRLTRRFVRQLVEQGVNRDKIQVVANRHGQRKQIAWKQAEQTLSLNLAEGIPDDATTMNEAVNQGQPLVKAARRAGITKAFDKLAARVAGRTLLAG